MKAMLLAAGAGTRLRPLTLRLPKVMVPVANRPVLEYLVRHLAAQGFSDLAVNLNYLPDPITAYFGDGSRWGVHIMYSLEAGEVLGTAGGVKKLQPFLDSDSFLVVGGDDLTTADLRAFADAHRAHEALASILVRHAADPSEYGLVQFDDDFRITGFVEKPQHYPAGGGWVSAGIYCFHPRIFADIPADSVYDFARQVFPTILARGERFFVHQAAGYWRDIGHLGEYLAANQELVRGIPGIAAPGEARGTFRVEPGARIAATAVIEGASLIGEGAAVEAGARVCDSVIGARVTVGAEAVLEDCVVWPDTDIPAGAQHRRAILLPDEVVPVP